MAFIKCPDCGKYLSDAAPSCPSCGGAVRAAEKSVEAGEGKDAGPRPGKARKWTNIILVAAPIILLAAVGIALITAQEDEGALPDRDASSSSGPMYAPAATPDNAGRPDRAARRTRTPEPERVKPGFTLENVNRIENGMTLDQVMDILRINDQLSDFSRLENKSGTLAWYSDAIRRGQAFGVDFVDGRVIALYWFNYKGTN